MNKFLNLTPHAITIVREDGSKTVFSPSGQVARVDCETVVGDYIDEIPITMTQYSEVTGLPAPEENTYYIVSRIVAERVNRTDVLIPNESVRDEEGNIIGCKSLARIGQEKTTSKLSSFAISELLKELRAREEVVAVQCWQSDDVVVAIKDAGYYPTAERIVNISSRSEALEDCSDGWEKLSYISTGVLYGEEDLGTEIKARFRKASENSEDELEFFISLAVDGITLWDIQEHAPEYYEYSARFMKEHGL